MKVTQNFSSIEITWKWNVRGKRFKQLDWKSAVLMITNHKINFCQVVLIFIALHMFAANHHGTWRSLSDYGPNCMDVFVIMWKFSRALKRRVFPLPLTKCRALHPSCMLPCEFCRARRMTCIKNNLFWNDSLNTNHHKEALVSTGMCGEGNICSNSTGCTHDAHTPQLHFGNQTLNLDFFFFTIMCYIHTHTYKYMYTENNNLSLVNILRKIILCTPTNRNQLPDFFFFFHFIFQRGPGGVCGQDCLV